MEEAKGTGRPETELERETDMAQMIETPRIIRETSKGYDAYTILEDMLARRELECTGELNDSRFW